MFITIYQCFIISLLRRITINAGHYYYNYDLIFT